MDYFKITMSVKQYKPCAWPYCQRLPMFTIQAKPLFAGELLNKVLYSQSTFDSKFSVCKNFQIISSLLPTASYANSNFDSMLLVCLAPSKDICLHL